MNDPGTREPTFADGLDVRALGLGDIALVRRLQIKSFLALAGSDLSDEEASAFEAWAVSEKYTTARYEATERGELFGAYHDGRLIGTSEWAHSTSGQVGAQIRGLFVDPLFTRCGTGSRLLAELEFRAGQAGFADMGLRTTLSAIGFFDRHGYVLTSHGQISLGPSHTLGAAFMRKPLHDAAGA